MGQHLTSNQNNSKANLLAIIHQSVFSCSHKILLIEVCWVFLLFKEPDILADILQSFNYYAIK